MRPIGAHKLYASYEGQDPLQPLRDNPNATRVVFNATIDDGTGRFKDATGFFEWQGERVRFPGGLSGIDAFEINGLISSVGSTTSAHIVPEPTSLSLAFMSFLAFGLIRRRPDRN